MFRHVDRELARARSGADSANAAANSLLSRRVVRVMERTPEGKRVAWTVDVPAGLMGRIDPRILPRRWAILPRMRRGTRADVRVKARAEDGAVVLAVIDDGPGIPPEPRRRCCGEAVGSIIGFGRTWTGDRRRHRRCLGCVVVHRGAGAGLPHRVAHPRRTVCSRLAVVSVTSEAPIPYGCGHHSRPPDSRPRSRQCRP